MARLHYQRADVFYHKCLFLGCRPWWLVSLREGHYLWYKPLVWRKNCLDKSVVKNHQIIPIAHEMSTSPPSPRTFWWLQICLHQITNFQDLTFSEGDNCRDYTLHDKVTISFTLHGNGNFTGAIGNNGPWSLSPSPDQCEHFYIVLYFPFSLF